MTIISLWTDRSQQRTELALKLFSRAGKFLGEIGDIGKGPCEYSRVSSYACLEASDRIYVLNSYPSKLLVYNFDRKCMGNIPIANNAAKVIALEPDRIGIMYMPHNEMENDSARFEWIDSKGKVLASIPLYENRSKDGGGMYSRGARLQQIDDEIHFIEWPFDTLYYLTEDKHFIPKNHFNLGDNKMPRDLHLDIMKFNENFKTYDLINRIF